MKIATTCNHPSLPVCNRQPVASSELGGVPIGDRWGGENDYNGPSRPGSPFRRGVGESPDENTVRPIPYRELVCYSNHYEIHGSGTMLRFFVPVRIRGCQPPRFLSVTGTTV